MASATLRKIVTDIAVKDQAYIMDLLKKSGILKTINVMMSSDGHFHKYKKVSELPSGNFRNVGSAYSAAQTVDDEIKQLDMKILGAYQTEDKVICDQRGKLAYFAAQRPVFMEGLGQTLANQVIYGTNATYGNVSGFKGWHELATDTTDAGGTTSTTTIFVVKYSNQSGLVLDSSFMNAGSMFQTTAVGGGTVQMVSGLPSYQVLYEGSMALLADSTYAVSRIYGVNASNAPTAAEIDAAIDAIRGDSDGSTFIYTSRTGRTAMNTLKNSKLEMGAMDMNYDTRIDYWNGIPVVVDDNIRIDETKANL